MPEANSSKIDCSESKSSESSIKKWLLDNLLLLGTLLGVTIGGVIGFGLRPLSLPPNLVLLISYPGELFMRLLKLIILPLIVSSLVAGSASLNAKLNGRIAVRTLVYFLCTSVMNAMLGVCLVTAIHPGTAGVKEALGAGTETREASSVLDSLLDLGRNIVADNIFQATFQQSHTAYVNTTVQTLDEATNEIIMDNILVREVRYRYGINTLGIVFFCLIFGTILGTLGEKSRPVINIFSVTFDVVMKFVTGVMWLTPFGICSVIAGKILSVNDLTLVMSNLGLFIVTVVLGVFIYQLIILQLIYLAIVRRNPFHFYFGLTQGALTAFATASTAAALPITFRLMDDRLRVDTRITRFVLPIGCNINMDGTAMFVAIAAIFIAQMNGIALSFGELVTVICTSTAASFSTASVPSAALVLLLMVLSSIDTPVQDVSLLFAVDWIVDRFRTTNNMLGDCYTAAIVEVLSKKELLASDTEQESMNSENDTIISVKKVSEMVERILEENKNGKPCNLIV